MVRTISDLLERLRQRKWRLTPQRRVVAEVLNGENIHLTAEVVHLRAQQRLAEISIATVYNTLNELVEMGEVLEIAAGDGPKRYDPNARHPHHHLVCTKCGALRDVFYAPTPSLELANVDTQGFVVTGVDVVYQGTCPSCASGLGSEANTATA